MKFEPHEYQKFAIRNLIGKKRIALFLDMGLGKTACTLTAINELIYNNLEINKVLVISPLKVARLTWQEEIEKWDHLHHLRLSRVVGTEKQRIKALNTNADIYIINRENTQWLLDFMREERAGRWPFQMMVIDESSSFKNRASQRFKAAKVMTQITPRLVELTGTPAPNGLMDLWAQIFLLDQGARLGRTITQYRDTFFLPDKRNRTQIWSYKLKKGAEQEIYRRIKDIAVSMKAEDHIRLPERVNSIIHIDMPEKIRRIYEEMENEFLISIEEETVVATSAGVVMNKLLQMANGAVYTSESPNWVLIHDLKLKALEEIMEANEGKSVMVFYQYQHDLARLQEYFKARKPRILQNDQDKRDWDEGRIEMLLAHPASMGHGLNLQAGGHIIVWFGLTWNLEQYQQANARLYRQGQKESVIINHICMSRTADDIVMNRLTAKSIVQDDLINAVKAKIKEAKEKHK